MNLSVARMDQHKGRRKRTQETNRGTEITYVAWKGP